MKQGDTYTKVGMPKAFPTGNFLSSAQPVADIYHTLDRAF